MPPHITGVFIYVFDAIICIDVFCHDTAQRLVLACLPASPPSAMHQHSRLLCGWVPMLLSASRCPARSLCCLGARRLGGLIVAGEGLCPLSHARPPHRPNMTITYTIPLNFRRKNFPFLASLMSSTLLLDSLAATCHTFLMNPDTTLAKTMLDCADADRLPIDHPVRTTTEAFTARAYQYFDEPQRCTVQQFIGAWARARRTWHEYSGEPLV